MTLTIRPQTPADFPAIGALEGPIVGVPFDANAVAKQAEEAGSLFCAVVAERDGQVIGRASAGFMPRHTPLGDLRCLVADAPQARRQGVGTALWGALQPLLAERRPNHLRSNLSADDPAAVAWAQGLGFSIAHHHLFQTLDLTSFEAAAGQSYIDAAEARGFQFLPFARLRTPENEARFHALYAALDRDTPDASSTETPSWADGAAGRWRERAAPPNCGWWPLRPTATGRA